ncbi:MAG: type IV secretory system conjugative DNA transfer family protein [Neisseriaceae bacterium]|nr:type IV secretory system conjugative DNA transfer family protein [Neisseriaceae bacterium]
MDKTSLKPLLIFTAILLIIFTIGGAFLGSWTFASLVGLKSWGFSTLWDFYHSDIAHKPNIHWKLMVAMAVFWLMVAIPIVLLILALIFGRQKRELHGSQRFATYGEIRQKGLLPTDDEIRKGKYPYIYVGAKVGKQFIRWCSNEFMLLATRTRGGKGVSTVITNCLKYAHSMVVFDPKLENYFLTSGHRQSMKQKVFLFNPAGRLPTAEDGVSEEVLEKVQEMDSKKLYSHRWNPYSYISRDPLFMFSDIHNMAVIMYPKSAKGESANSSFWIETARNLFIGLSMYMLETEEERLKQDPNAVSSLALLYKLATPTGDLNLVDWIKYQVLGQQPPKEKAKYKKPRANISDACAEFLADFANGNAKTGSDILSTFKAPLTIFKDPIVAVATSGDDFDLRDLRKQKMTVYLGIMPNDIERFERLTNLFFSQLINENIKQGLPEHNKALKYQCLLLLDEFTALGYMPILEKGVAYIAGYNLRMLIIFQSPKQVERVYSSEGSQVFFSNFAIQTLFGCKSQKDAEEYSALVGYETFKAKSQSRSFGRNGSKSQNVSDQKRALILPDEFKTMPDDKCVVTMTGMRPIMADKIMYYKEPSFKGLTDKKPCNIPVLEVMVNRSGSLNNETKQDNTISGFSFDDDFEINEEISEETQVEYIQGLVDVGFSGNLKEVSRKKIHQMMVSVLGDDCMEFVQQFMSVQAA